MLPSLLMHCVASSSMVSVEVDWLYILCPSLCCLGEANSIVCVEIGVFLEVDRLGACVDHSPVTVWANPENDALPPFEGRGLL